MTDTVTDSLVHDGLLVGDFPVHTQAVTVGQSQTLARGCVVGKITATGYIIACAHDAVDGSQTPYGVMVEAVTTTSAELPGLVYDFGLFASDKLTFGGTSDIDDLKDAMKAANLYVNTPTTM
jgi:hypothetical protein